MTLSDSGYLMRRDPVIGRLGELAEPNAPDRCTYAGIAKKLALFLTSIAMGCLLCGIAKVTGSDPLDEQLHVNSVELILLAAAALIALITPWPAISIRKTTPVTGTMFCAAVGYIVMWLGATLGRQYRAAIVLSFLITILLVCTMCFLYGRGIIRADRGFRTFLMTACITLIAGSLMTFIGSLIPATRGLVSELAADPILSLGVGVVMVILGSLFLISDLDTIRQCVEGGMSKDYEWYASFGLAFSVIWLYFKVLQLVLRFMGRGSSRSGKR
ncbi:MAG: Bax inhibitor-1/YccA family protein [Oscillospiraceae bacterium]|nr:Bax inhibitor-1/YccA family protein [Oscillospiraceae bacterium]